MKTFQKLIIYFILSIFTIPNLFSIPATPFPVTITQPDGTQITIRLHGDENFNYKTTLDGYVLSADDAGILNYVQIDINGKLTTTAVKANEILKRTSSEKKFILTLKQNPDLSKMVQSRKAFRSKNMISALGPQKAYPLTGSPKSLVILVNFSDVKFVTASPKTAYTNLLNQSGYSANGGTGSAKDYFHDASMGVFNPQFDVIGPVTLDNNMAYYGANAGGTAGQDSNPQQMVIDACTKAASLVDFSQYDTDKNGIVDNVFIYYAGYNEAEGGPANSIWPHKWNLNDYNTKFNGVSIFHYACTSELRGNTGSNMCGIGTFCHEFGHVLGLDDYYVTSTTAVAHHTLSIWNIMDYGAYLNLGRTPPTYCAYDRYFLNWLVPVELKTAGDYSLEYLGTSNKAYMISQSGNRNLAANDASSPEYFLLENRQKTGWDNSLGNYGHGMIVYHIYYNKTTWDNNEPNNDPNAMGVDIVEADGISYTETSTIDSTLSGDPFPGKRNVKTFNPILRNGTNIKKPLVEIQEINGVIKFHFASNIVLVQNLQAFTTVQGTPSAVQTVIISGTKLKAPINLSFKSGLNYEMKKDTDPATAWSKNITLTPIDSVVTTKNIQIRYNPTVPSFNDIHYDSFIALTSSGDYADAAISGTSTRPVYVVAPIATDATNNSFTGFVANWNAVSDSIGKLAKYYLTLYNNINGKINYVLQDVWLTSNSDTISNLTPGTEYFYKVKASDKSIYYENITDFSNTVSASTSTYPFKNKLVTKVESNGDVTVFLPKVQTILFIYNLLGQTVKTITPKGTVIKITDLPKNQAYILKADNLITKIAN